MNPCPKCGGQNVSIRYHEGSAYWGDALHCANSISSRRGNSSYRKGEHLHYRCGRCGYDWTGDVLAKEPSP